jgi:hypothetical protein
MTIINDYGDAILLMRMRRRGSVLSRLMVLTNDPPMMKLGVNLGPLLLYLGIVRETLDMVTPNRRLCPLYVTTSYNTLSLSRSTLLATLLAPCYQDSSLASAFRARIPQTPTTISHDIMDNEYLSLPTYIHGRTRSALCDLRHRP